MNRHTMEGNWKKLKGRMKARWGKLTGSRADEFDGKRDEMAGNVQKGYGEAKDGVEEQTKRFEKAAVDSDHRHS